ncbi:MAG: DEAD/DEAH box helicase family protein [Bacteriovoracaceae bacterium]|nr:DEAD/DEAH box helicase family protein [Bacteriovoracaceae bacterium]
MSLGKWSFIDIETTGIDESYDEIIDVGFLAFEGTKLVKEYSSLVRTENELSQFIQKLTGITPAMMKRAPRWEEVSQEVLELDGSVLIAHNAEFEKKFLNPHFEKINTAPQNFQDTLFYLALLNPGRASLNLESFIVECQLRETEVHRGYEDSLDLLKVLLIATYRTYSQLELRTFMYQQLSVFEGDEFWFKHFFNLTQEELLEIAEQIKFDLIGQIKKIEKVEKPNTITRKKLPSKFDGKAIADIFQGDEIKKRLPQFHYREGQELLAKRVGQAFTHNVHGLIQAPTGTGKTLGYLVPATLFALTNNQKILITTGTKTLQEQLMSKDIPILRDVLGLDESEFRIKKLIGSGNHLCELQFRNQNEAPSLLANFQEKMINSYLEVVFFQNTQHVMNEKRITRLDLPYVFKMILDDFEETEKKIAVDFRACIGFKCPFKDSCSYYQGIQEAKDANIVVGNHSLSFQWPKALERPAYVIVDEAHKIEGEATKAFALELDQKSLDKFARSILNFQGLGALFYLMNNHLDPAFAEKDIEFIKQEFTSLNQVLMEHLSQLPQLIESYFKKSPKFNGTYWNELNMISKNDRTDEIRASLYNRFDSIKNIFQAMYELLLPKLQNYGFENLTADLDTQAWSRFEFFWVQIEDSYKILNLLLESDETYYRSLKYHDSHGYEVHVTPIDVGAMIHEQLLKVSSSVVMTSATLADEEGKYGQTRAEWMTGYIYLAPEKRFKTSLFIKPVFDYANKAKVFLCDDTPSLYDAQFVPTLMQKLIPVMKDIGGRTLLLFSSRQRFEVAREILLKEFQGKIQVFVQGMGQNVVDEFKKSEQGILLGMESFGEGIDVPGDKLQLVFIDKIPDIGMELVIDARRKFFDKTFGQEFNQYFLPFRAQLLQQKLGRLLRSETDHGVVIVVDSRIKKWQPRTMKHFYELLKPYALMKSNFETACNEARTYLLGPN